MPLILVCPRCGHQNASGRKFCFGCRKSLPPEVAGKPFRAEYRFKRDFERREFDFYEQAKEWCCIRLENLGEMREPFASVKIYRSNVCVWQLPQPKPEHRAQSFVGFNLLTMR